MKDKLKAKLAVASGGSALSRSAARLSGIFWGTTIKVEATAGNIMEVPAGVRSWSPKHIRLPEEHRLMKAFCFASAVVVSLMGFGAIGQLSQVASKPFPEETTTKLTAEIEKQMREQNLPGVIVAVTAPGESEYVAALGKANLETSRAMNAKDPFRIGSITKTFTATAILQLVDQGKLSKSDRLEKWFPDFPNADKITIDDLLRMRSGIAEGRDPGLLKKHYDEPLAEIKPETIIQRSASRAAQFEPPNQKTVYRDVNYAILGEILRKVSGKDIAEQINESVVKPLGLKDTLYPADSKLPGELHGYGWDAKARRYDDKTLLNPANSGGAGAMISTAADLQTFSRLLYKGQLLKPATQEARLDTQPFDKLSANYGYGEGIMKVGSFWGHSGGTNGFQCQMWYLPEKDATIVIAVNRCDDDLGQARVFGGNIFPTVVKAFFPEALKGLTGESKPR
jgi:D-alanyl-D-alanine carboxypeptidase